ncbi:MAG: hypothetical protein J7M24_02185 [Candidatus Latescibacteria bacterium]|nr:hypothetical protein [Candidatus Latescibacterota bacterium]
MIDARKHTSARPAPDIIELTGHARSLRRRIEGLTAKYRELDCIVSAIRSRPGQQERIG